MLTASLGFTTIRALTYFLKKGPGMTLFAFKKPSLTLTGLCLLLSLQATAQDDNAPLKPTEVVYFSLKAMAQNPTADRIATINRFFERMDVTSLSGDQQFALGEVYFLNFKPRESLEQYEKFMDGNGLRARIAWQKAMQIQFRAFNRHDLVEEMIEQYWQRFPPIPQDIWHADWQIANLARKYQDDGEHQKVVDIILREINRLPRSAPYRSFRLPRIFMRSFVETGQDKEANMLIRDIVADMRDQLAAEVQKKPEGIVMFKAIPLTTGTYYRMEEGLDGAAFAEGYPKPALRIRQYMQLISELGANY